MSSVLIKNFIDIYLQKAGSALTDFPPHDAVCVVSVDDESALTVVLLSSVSPQQSPDAEACAICLLSSFRR